MLADPTPEPNEKLVRRWLAAELELEQMIPTGDPGAIRCTLPDQAGVAYGRGRVLVGPHRFLMCTSCDGQGQGFAPAWSHR